jgi:opacity protein-like surface antigen
LYAGAGLGYAGTRTDYTATINGIGSSYSDSDDSASTQLLAGVHIPYGPSGAIKLGWRYVRADDVSLLGVSNLETDSHAFEFGINIEF